MTLANSRHAVQDRTINLRFLRRKPIILFLTAAVVTGVVTLVVAMWLGGLLTESSFDGLLVGYRAGLTDFGLSASKSLVDLLSAGVIGMLLIRLLLPEQDRTPSPTARRCLRTGSQLALAWAIFGVVLTIFTWSDGAGTPVTNLPITKLFTDPVGIFPAAVDYLSTAVLALVIAVGIAVTESRLGTMILLPLALYNLVPIAMQGHRNGDIQISSLIVHVMAVSLWVGGLAALLMHVRGQPALLAVAVPRFSTIALGCYVTIAVTGVIAAAVEFDSPPDDLWESRYGVLVMLLTTALITLGALAWWHRRYTVRLIRRQDARARRAFIQLAAAEMLVMVAAVVLAVVLSRTVSPDTGLEHVVGGGVYG